MLLGITIVLAGATRAGNQAVPTLFPAETAQIPESLRQWSRMDSTPSTETLKAFQRGMDHYLAGRYSAALEALPDEKAAESTGIGDYILYYRAKSNLELERNKEALAGFRLLETRYPDSRLAREALMQQCAVLLELNQPKAALAVLEKPQIVDGSESVYCQARAFDLSGEKEKAADLYLRIYSLYPTSEQSALAQKRLISLSPGALKGASSYDARLNRAENLIRAGRYSEARSILTALGRFSAPSSKSAEKKNLLIGEAEYRLGKISLAIRSLEKITAANPALHVKALYLQGLCARNQERRQDFLGLRDRLLKLYPSSTQAEELCYSVATFFDVNYEASNSRNAYAVLYEGFPKGRYSERALWKLALFSYSGKDYGDAALGFWKYLRANADPVSAPPAMYWIGRCYERLGDVEKAKYLYRQASRLANASYYGQRAREAEAALEQAVDKGAVIVSGIDFKKLTMACEGIEPPHVTLEEPDAAGANVIERARRLVSVGLSDLALSELRWGRTHQTRDHDALCYVMARIYSNRRDHYEAIVSIRTAFPDYTSLPTEALPDEVWDMLYPVRHWGTISEQAGKYEIDPNLVLGLIRQESAFEEKARSKANARGLMQVLPSTGRLLARQSPRVPRYNAQKLYQAETNIILGTRFLSSLLQQLGKPELALAAYNAGKSRVDRWLEEWGDLDMVEFVEQIPFSETRGYVKQVLSNRIRYSLLTSSSKP